VELAHAGWATGWALPRFLVIVVVVIIIVIIIIIITITITVQNV